MGGQRQDLPHARYRVVPQSAWTCRFDRCTVEKLSDQFPLALIDITSEAVLR